MGEKTSDDRHPVNTKVPKVKAAQPLELISTTAFSEFHKHIIFIIGLMSVAKQSLMQVISLA